MKKRPLAQNERNLWPWEDTEEPGPAPKSRDVAFFFGAGASVEAGVPHTAGLLEEFIKSLPTEETSAVENFLNRLKSWAHGQEPRRLVDIELVLETLQHAVNWKSDPLAAFMRGELEVGDVDPNKLLLTLRDFVKDRVMVQAEKIKYLAPLRGFIDQYKPLNVFSANYDTAVEVLCAEHKLKYRDGFDEVWNPSVFDDPDIHIKLFKIHGSVTWYRTDRGRFVKIPTMVKGSSVELFTKERAELVMLYPAQKFEYVEPLFELTLQMKRELAQCRTLFVVGYSFRDEHIRKLFWDIARQHSDFYVVLIDPNAQRIYGDRLRHYDASETLSSLSGRVVRLPYHFGKVLPSLQSVIYQAFRKMRADVDALGTAERQGQVTHWQECMLPAAVCGDYETLRMVLEKVTERKFSNYPDLMKSTALALCHAIANEDQEFIAYFWNQLQSHALAPVDQLILVVDKTPEGNVLRPMMLGGALSSNSLIEAWNEARRSVDNRLKWIGPNARLQALIELLQQLNDHMSVWRNGNARFNDYLSDRGTFARGNLESLLKNLSRPGDMVWDGKDRREQVEADLRIAEVRVLNSVFEQHRETVLTLLGGGGVVSG